MLYRRSDFINKLIQAGLLGLLILITSLLGNRTVSGNNCSECPGKGFCNGESDCSKFKF